MSSHFKTGLNLVLGKNCKEIPIKVWWCGDKSCSVSGIIHAFSRIRGVQGKACHFSAALAPASSKTPDKILAIFCSSF